MIAASSITHIIKCARCGKTLTRAHWHGGKPYGVICIKLYSGNDYINEALTKVIKAKDFSMQLDLL